MIQCPEESHRNFQRSTAINKYDCSHTKLFFSLIYLKKKRKKAYIVKRGYILHRNDTIKDVCLIFSMPSFSINSCLTHHGMLSMRLRIVSMGKLFHSSV